MPVRRHAIIIKMIPGEDGISVLKKLRAMPSTAAVPVIMATAKGSEYDKVIGLDLGADDYLCKPFGMMEMVSRIRAGLGLSIVKHAAMIHDARIRVSRELGKGSVFTVDFPKYLAEG